MLNSDVVQYVWEIVTWEEIGEDVEITIRHSNNAQCGEFSEYLTKQIRKKDENGIKLFQIMPLATANLGKIDRKTAVL